MMLNRKKVYSSGYHYAHRSHMKTLLNFGTDMKIGELRAAFLYEDTQNKFDVLDNVNAGFQLQKQLSVARSAIPLM